MFLTKFFHSKAPPSSSNAPVQLVHQLWPPEDTVCSIDFDIVFFHGVRKPGETEAWKNTWVEHTSAQEFWVQDWLPQDLDGNVRVLALSYDSCAIQSNNEGNLQDVSDLGKNLLQSLVFSGPWRLGQQHGCVLVGHSFGGLVIKSMVVNAYEEARCFPMNSIHEQVVASARRFLQNLRGVVNYAVPHNGSFLESYFTLGHNLSRRVKLAGFMKHLQPFPRGMENLSVDFDHISHEKSINVLAFLEDKPVKDLGKLMVPRASAQRCAGRDYYTLEDCDHFSVCKPIDKSHLSYVKLVECIRVCQQEDSFLRELRFSSEVPQEPPNIIEGTSEVPQGLPNIMEGTSEVPQELPNIIVGTSEVPQARPNIKEGVPSQDLELAANTLMNLQILILPQKEISAAKQSELNLLTDEVDRAQSRLLSLEREKEQLQLQLEAVHNQEAQFQERQEEEASSNLEASLSAKEKIISELHLELRNVENARSKEREEHLLESKRLNTLVNEKAVGYNSIEAEDWEIVVQGEDIGKLETLLLEKNRKMEHELTLVKGIQAMHDLNPQSTSTNPDLVVIFFHGIGYGKNDEWKEAWTSTTNDGKHVCWPQEWLPVDLATQNVNNVRILSFSYDFALLGGNEDVTDIGKNLVQSLVSKSEYEPLWEAPIVLVGYSFGGLVVKSLVVEVDKLVNARIVDPKPEIYVHPKLGNFTIAHPQAPQSCTKFLNNLKGTIFYGVPHTHGGEDFKQFFVWECQRLNDAKNKHIAKSRILRNIEGFNRQMAKLSIDFETAVDPTLIIYAFGEGQPVRRGESVLVPYASAQYLAHRNHYKVEDATHITICQPTSQQAINYSLLKDVLLTIMKMGGKGGSMCTKSEEYDKPVVGELEAHGIKDAHCKEPTVGESETPGSMFGNLETNEMATGGGIGTPGSMLLTLETHKMPTGGEIANPGSMFMMFETHEMPASGEIGTHESIGAELETHEMPASGKIGTHESISAELETHEMPTCGEIQSPGIMFAKLETHQTPTVAEIETLGMDSQVYQHASESLIAFGWRLSLEDNALEFFFPSAHSMSRIVGVGLEFAKVVVSTTNLNVKIIGIGKRSWKNVWSNFTTLDKKLEVISLDGVTGAGSHNNSSNEYLTGEESASKYGVGFCSGNTVRVQFTDAPHESDYCLVLHNLVEYLMLKKVDLAKIGVQCTQDGGAGSSSHGGNSSDQGNNNVTSSIGQGLSYMSYLSKGKWKSNTGDDEDGLPPSKEARKVEHDSAKKNRCKITVLPGPGGSFLSKKGTKLEEAPNGLDDASVDPELEFEFDKNGKIGKQIYVRTTTTFDLGNAAPTEKVKNSFGWYHDNLKTTLRNPERLAKLGISDLFMGNPKDTKLSVRQTQTHSDNDESEVSAELQLGYQGTHVQGGYRKKGTKGDTTAREEGYEICTSSDVWRGFIYQDLRSTIKSSACWKFTCSLPSPLPLKVLRDDNEWKKYLGSGMCGALKPIFDTKWRIQEEDDTENSVYEFEAERTLNMLSTINGRQECLEIIQKYGLRMFVNHAMNHLSNVKDNHILREWGILSEVMTVGFVTVLTSGSG